VIQAGKGWERLDMGQGRAHIVWERADMGQGRSDIGWETNPDKP